MPIFTNEIAKRCARWLLASTAPEHLRADHPVKDDLAAACDEIERLAGYWRKQQRDRPMEHHDATTEGTGTINTRLGGSDAPGIG
jgi:hypothetical protein